MTRRFGPPRNRRAQPLRVHQPRLVAKTPAQLEAAALRQEAALTWSDATGQPPYAWLGPLMDPLEEMLIPAIQTALREGASVDVRGAWAIIITAAGKRLVVAGDLLRDVLNHQSSPWS